MKGTYKASWHPYNCNPKQCAPAFGYEQWEIVYDGISANGLPSIGMIIDIDHDLMRTNSNGNRCVEEISKCPDEIAAKALPFIERGLLCYATPEGDVIGRREAETYQHK